MAVVDLVDFNMVNAIRLVSIDRGLDPREFTLVSFGGACSLHANSWPGSSAPATCWCPCTRGSSRHSG